jgi:hypothetical protein
MGYEAAMASAQDVDIITGAGEFEKSASFIAHGK